MSSEGCDVTIQTEKGWHSGQELKYQNMKRKILQLLTKERESIGRLEMMERELRESGQEKLVMKEEVWTDSEEPKRIPVRKTLPKAKDAIEKNEAGEIILPVTIGQLKVISLGQVDYERSEFHNHRYIYPIGYTVERVFASIDDPKQQTTYTCSIVDRGDNFPMFQLSTGKESIEANSSSGVWCALIEKINRAKGKKGKIAVSGPVQYGLAHPLVRKMIEQLPNADKCKNYTLR
ncbi:F/Y-rich N-terminus-domain-containing protein [Sporodiniella umbellata]|nr:F/Y-rich N-terminus-domain-containing protein [Sporodiniella umbellata]